MDDENRLLTWIRERLAVSGPVSFAQFMEWALYQPEWGYYSVGPDIGPHGDFTTSPEASPAFGRLLAVHAVEIDALLGQPSAFYLVECGPGRGALAADLLDSLAQDYPDLYGRLRYWLVEISSGFARMQRDRLMEAHGSVVIWVERLEQVARGVEGAVIANEVVDAFAVHVLENRGGVILEQFVDMDDSENLRIVHGPPSRRELLDFLEQYQIELEPGQKVEINLAAGDWVSQVAQVLGRGVATIIDYGDISPARYSERRKEGTLLGYYGGEVTDNVLANPGKQDLTALVDVTALRDAATGSGFAEVGLTRQANFLLGLGLGTTITAVSAGSDLGTALTNRRGLQALVNPEGLGKFHVLLLAKGLDAERVKAGLSGLKYADI